MNLFTLVNCLYIYLILVLEGQFLKIQFGISSTGNILQSCNLLKFFKIFQLQYKIQYRRNLRNNFLNFITLNKDNFFFELKKIFLLITLHIDHSISDLEQNF